MAGDVLGTTRPCLYFADTIADALVRPTQEETPHEREQNIVVHFDFLHMRDSTVDSAVDAADAVHSVWSSSRT